MKLKILCANNNNYTHKGCKGYIEISCWLNEMCRIVENCHNYAEVLQYLYKNNSKYLFDKWIIDKEKIFCPECSYKANLEIKQRDCKHKFTKFWFDIADCHDSIVIYEICHICQLQNTKTIMTPYEMITKLGIFKNKDRELEDE